MTERSLTNVAASARARLTDQARRRGDDVQLVLLRYAIERFLYRLAQSPYRDHFILKGAMLFSLWAPVPYRSTGDLDLLGQGDPAPLRMAAIFKAVCDQAVADDGLVFEAASVVAEAARADEEYQGVRISLMAKLGNARLPLQIDIGFGDAVTPAATEITYPTLLDFPAATLRAYPPETVVAEKLEALVSLGIRNSRMKDFFDLWAIATTFAFEGATLAAAVQATFTRRQTPLPNEYPIALTAAFAADEGKQAQWRAFLSRTTITLAPEPFPDLIVAISRFATPLLKPDAMRALAAAGWAPETGWINIAE